MQVNADRTRGGIAYEKMEKKKLQLNKPDGKKHHRELKMINYYGGRVVLTQEVSPFRAEGPSNPWNLSDVHLSHKHSGFAVMAQLAPHRY